MDSTERIQKEHHGAAYTKEQREIFRARFRELKKEFKYRSIDIAEKLGYSTKDAIDAWSAGRNVPKRPALKSLAELFNTTPEYLLGDVKYRDGEQYFTHLCDDFVERTERNEKMFDAVSAFFQAIHDNTDEKIVDPAQIDIRQMAVIYNQTIAAAVLIFNSAVCGGKRYCAIPPSMDPDMIPDENGPYL